MSDAEDEQHSSETKAARTEGDRDYKGKPRESANSGATEKKPRDRSAGTIKPRYGERRPMTYHLFESEMRQISSLNAQAVAFFSLGAFCLAILVDIEVGAAFATFPLSEIGKLFFKWGAVLCGGLAFIFYGFGVYFLHQKRSATDLIKKETMDG
jgi:hypothetical protein